MVGYQNQTGYENPFSEEMSWDLRQFFARFVAVHMVDYYQTEKKNDYPSMLHNLDKWHGTILGKISTNKKFSDEYPKLKKELIEIANKHRDTYLGKKNNSVATSEISSAFIKIKTYLIFLMEENQMFGAKKEFSGL